MLSEPERQRLNHLRRREAEGSLTESEREELQSIFAALDAQEEQALRPAWDRAEARQVELQRENEQLTHKVAELERIRGEYEQLLQEVPR